MMKPFPSVAAPAAACCALLLAACGSSAPPPNAALAASGASLEAARAAGAAELASVEMTGARNKLERARALAQQGRNRDAIRMAEEADADAQVARALAGSERAKRAVAEVEAGLATLRQELQRTPATAPGTAPRTPQ
jgi:hypothetical protein